jgi:hypothetical protein
MKKLFFLFLITFLFSCHSARLSTEDVKNIDKEDNNLCMAEGVEYKDQDTRLLYWECRARIMDQRISGEFGNYGYDVLYKTEFKKLRALIEKRIIKLRELIKTDVENSSEKKGYNYCLIISHKVNEDGSRQTYFDCKNETINKIKNEKNEDLSNEAVIKLITEELEEKEKLKSVKVEYVEEDCIKYVGSEEDLNKCKKILVQINDCYKGLDRKIIQRKLEDRIFCSKESIEKYPDSLAKFDEKSKNTNVGPKIDKLEVIKLRKKEYEDCISNRTSRINNYKNFLKNTCKKKNFEGF